MINRKTAPPVQQCATIDLRRADSLLLTNNIPLHTIFFEKHAALKLEIIIKGGKWFEPSNGTAHFAAKMLGEGSSSKTAKEIARRIAYYGAFFEANAGLDFINIGFFTLSMHFEKLLPLISEIIFDAAFPSDELDKLKKNQLQKLKIDSQRNDILASQKIKEAVFGALHPYGKILVEENIHKISQKGLINYHDIYVKPDFHILLSGNFSDQHIQLIDKYFGYTAVKPVTDYPAHKLPSERKSVYIEKKESVQASIRIGKILLKKTHPDFIKLLIVNELFGGFMGSRLMQNIREDKGLTYGIYSRMLPFKNEGYFVIGTEVKKDFAGQTIEEIHKEMKKLREEEVSSEELGTVKNYMIGKFLSKVNNPFSLIDHFKETYFYDLSYDYYQEFIQTIDQIDSSTIQQTAHKYLWEDDMTEVVVG